MATSVIEKVLGSNKFYTDEYVRDTIDLVKSFVIKNDKEADLYNDYLLKTVPGWSVEPDPVDWRYYRHVMGLPYRLDETIVAVSVDNGMEFVFNKEALLIHRRTKEELLKFGRYYQDLVKAYPELELFIKGVITTPIISDVREVVNAENFTIVSYAGHLVEESEDNVLPKLQLRINNYKHIWMIGYYSMVDNLFLAAQYSILAHYLVTSLLAIRLENCKTVNVHSYHVRLYLASHHYLDDVLMFLTKPQQMFLYRNMLYLNNHSGSNFTFQTLIDMLFSERNIAVVNYEYRQSNRVTPQGDIDFRFNQRLLNNRSLVHDTSDYTLESLAAKELPLAPDNEMTLKYGITGIEKSFQRSLFSKLLTKDLETILMDETDSVRYRLIQTLTDYWAYFLSVNRVSFLVDLTDPATNITTRISVRDLFKLYLIVIHANQGKDFKVFPSYHATRVLKDELPTYDQLIATCYDLDVGQHPIVQEILDSVPRYGNYLTSFQFEQYVSEVYKYNLATWTYLAGINNVDLEGQLSGIVQKLHKSVIVNINHEQETVEEFIERLGIEDPRGYNQSQLELYQFAILDNVYDKKLSFLSQYQKLQEALTKVFFKFNSYTVQLINNYYGDAPFLIGQKDTRYSHSSESTQNLSLVSENSLTQSLVSEFTTGRSAVNEVSFDVELSRTSQTSSVVDLGDLIDIDFEVKQHVEVNAVLIPKTILTDHDTAVKTEAKADFVDPVTFDGMTQMRSTEVRVGHAADITLCESSISVNVTQFLPINNGFELDLANTTPSQSSESTLMFLALNPL